MKCRTCDDTGIDEIGGYIIPCRNCPEGDKEIIRSLERTIKGEEASLRRNRKLLKKLKADL